MRFNVISKLPFGSGKNLPFDLKGQLIYYVGPSPAKPGQEIGSAGPTTSYRMDTYTPTLIKMGLKGTIGKGGRSKEVLEAMKRYKAVYFAAVGGAAALIDRLPGHDGHIDMLARAERARQGEIVHRLALGAVDGDIVAGRHHREAALVGNADRGGDIAVADLAALKTDHIVRHRPHHLGQHLGHYLGHRRMGDGRPMRQGQDRAGAALGLGTADAGGHHHQAGQDHGAPPCQGSDAHLKDSFERRPMRSGGRSVPRSWPAGGANAVSAVTCRRKSPHRS